MLLNNRYRILKSLGSGGFGETFSAEDTQTSSRRQCAIKRLHPVNNEPATFKLIKERFQRESEVLKNIGAGNGQIPAFFDYFEENGNFYLVQEFVEGKNLTEIVKEQGYFILKIALSVSRPNLQSRSA